MIACLYLARTRQASGALLVAMISGGLVYDNAIIALGSTIGIGSLLETLSWPRFIMHALLTPFMMIAATRIAISAGVNWAQSDTWRIVVWLLVIGGIVSGVFGHLIGHDIFPSCAHGILRYTGNLSPNQFCFPDQIAVQGAGPPIASIVGTIVTLVVGVSLWRRAGWIWLMTASLIMFVAAAVPISGYGLAPGNGGEVLLMAAFAASIARFARRKPIG